jgi:hypothetical protein
MPPQFCGRAQYNTDTPIFLIIGLIISAIVTFPFVWLAGWLSSLLDHLWLLPVGVLANGILWGQLLWFLMQRKNHSKQIKNERKDIS